MKLNYRIPVFSGAATEIGLIPIEATSTTQAITGASFANSQTFGAGIVTTNYEITGSSFTNNQTFGTGVITQPSASSSISNRMLMGVGL